jgi:hypothetical protein
LTYLDESRATPVRAPSRDRPNDCFVFKAIPEVFEMILIPA